MTFRKRVHRAHNSLEDARAFQSRVSRLEITVEDLLKDSFTIKFVFKRQNYIENKVKTCPSFKTMVNVKLFLMV